MWHGGRGRGAWGGGLPRLGKAGFVDRKPQLLLKSAVLPARRTPPPREDWVRSSSSSRRGPGMLVLHPGPLETRAGQPRPSGLLPGSHLRRNRRGAAARGSSGPETDSSPGFSVALCHLQLGLEQEPQWGPPGSWRGPFPEREAAHSSRSQAVLPVGYLKPRPRGRLPPGAQYSQQPSGDHELVPQLLLWREPYSSFQLWPGERGGSGLAASPPGTFPGWREGGRPV